MKVLCPAGAPLVVLQKGKARLFWEGAPMVYGGAVGRVDADTPPTSGSLVVLTDANLVPLGWGVYNSASMYRVRYPCPAQRCCPPCIFCLRVLVRRPCACLFRPVVYRWLRSAFVADRLLSLWQCLRVLQWCEESSESTLLELGPLLEARVLAAVSLRAALGLPSAATTVYRLINRYLQNSLHSLWLALFCC